MVSRRRSGGNQMMPAELPATIRSAAKTALSTCGSVIGGKWTLAITPPVARPRGAHFELTRETVAATDAAGFSKWLTKAGVMLVSNVFFLYRQLFGNRAIYSGSDYCGNAALHQPRVPWLG